MGFGRPSARNGQAAMSSMKKKDRIQKAASETRSETPRFTAALRSTHGCFSLLKPGIAIPYNWPALACRLAGTVCGLETAQQHRFSNTQENVAASLRPPQTILSSSMRTHECVPDWQHDGHGQWRFDQLCRASIDPPLRGPLGARTRSTRALMDAADPPNV